MGCIGLKGEGLGVFTNILYKSRPSVLVFNPISDSFFPECKHLGHYLSGIEGERSAFFSTNWVRQVKVNDIPVWRNRLSFGMAELGEDPHHQRYYGKGDLLLEFFKSDQVLDFAREFVKDNSWMRFC